MMERFIKEYANYQKRTIKNNKLMKGEIKEKAYINIASALNLRKRELITIDETITCIMNCSK